MGRLRGSDQLWLDAVQQWRLALRGRGDSPSPNRLVGLTGLSRNTVKGYLDGRRRPTPEFVAAMGRDAGMSVADLYADLGWMEYDEASSIGGPDDESLAIDVAHLQHGIERLEERLAAGTLARVPVPAAAVAKVTTSAETANRWRARVRGIVSGRRYPLVTDVVAEFSMNSNQKAMTRGALSQLADQYGVNVPDSYDLDDPYWRQRLELQVLTNELRRGRGDAFWQGEEATSFWQPAAERWPTQLLTQDLLGGESKPGALRKATDTGPSFIIFIGGRYVAQIAAPLVAEALGYRFLLVRNDTHFTSAGALAIRDRESPRAAVHAWGATARHIARSSGSRDGGTVVCLHRVGTLLDETALDLLRQTPASIVYARPLQSHLHAWEARQLRNVANGHITDRSRASVTSTAFDAVEEVVYERKSSFDLVLGESSGRQAPVRDQPPSCPSAIVDSQVRIAAATIDWLDETPRNRGSSLWRSIPSDARLAVFKTSLEEDRASGLFPTRS